MYKSKYGHSHPAHHTKRALYIPSFVEDETYNFGGEYDNPVSHLPHRKPHNELKPLIYEYAPGNDINFNQRELTSDSITIRSFENNTYVDGIQRGAPINTIEKNERMLELKDEILYLENKKEIANDRLNNAVSEDEKKFYREEIESLETQIEQFNSVLNPNYKVENKLTQLIDFFKGLPIIDIEEEKKQPAKKAAPSPPPSPPSMVLVPPVSPPPSPPISPRAPPKVPSPPPAPAPPVSLAPASALFNVGVAPASVFTAMPVPTASPPPSPTPSPTPSPAQPQVEEKEEVISIDDIIIDKFFVEPVNLKTGEKVKAVTLNNRYGDVATRLVDDIGRLDTYKESHLKRIAKIVDIIIDTYQEENKPIPQKYTVLEKEVKVRLAQ